MPDVTLTQALRQRLDQGLAEIRLPVIPKQSAGTANKGGDVEAIASNLDTAALDAQISDAQRQLLIELILLIQKWNKVHNLTAVRDPLDMIGRHVLDSLSVLPWLAGATKSTETIKTTYRNSSADMLQSTVDAETVTSLAVDVLDVGTGAGLPVLPLAIVRPDLNFLSVESSGKKTRFQQQALQELGLSNVIVRQARIQDVQCKAQTVVSRAFTAPEIFLQTIEPHCKPGATVLLMLGQAHLLPDALLSPYHLQSLHKLDIPFVESDRHVAVCSHA